MSLKDWQKPLNWTRDLLDKPFSRAFVRLNGVLQLHDPGVTYSDRVVIALMKMVLLKNGRLNEQALDAFHSVLIRDYSESEVAEYVAALKSCAPVEPEAALLVLGDFSVEQQRQIIEVLIMLSLCSGEYTESKQEFIRSLADGMPKGAIDFDAVNQEVSREYHRRRNLVKSGAGVLIAVIVIVVFIMMATWLKSVLFGTILAYIFLPMEKYFERKLGEEKSFIHRFFKAPDAVTRPLKRFAGRLRNQEESRLSADEVAQKKRQALISRATTLTVTTFIVMVVVIIFAFTWISGNYVAGLGSSVKKWAREKAPPPAMVNTPEEQSDAPLAVKYDAAEVQQEENAAPEVTLPAMEHLPPVIVKLANDLNQDLNNLKVRFQRLPLVSWGIEELAKLLQNPEAQQQIIKTLLEKSGGFLSFTASLLGKLVNLVLDLLLTVFFFSLILNKLALFAANSSTRARSDYLVRTVFNGKWLPGATEESLAEGERIISEVINKLRIWLRGYLLLMIIDLAVYTTTFILLDVPYPFVLGAIAACGILLPYIGPVASALLTLLVTLAVGGAEVSGLQLAGIVGIYLLENGLIEQFFLYPAIIGESLGLTTLETIIVVLLGGYFAGITGMIFAMPTAAVLKYLVPQIYNCWK